MFCLAWVVRARTGKDPKLADPSGSEGHHQGLFRGES
jgi:hypothetical protein